MFLRLFHNMRALEAEEHYSYVQSQFNPFELESCLKKGYEICDQYAGCTSQMVQAVYRKLVEITLIVQNGFDSLPSTLNVTVGILPFKFAYEN